MTGSARWSWATALVGGIVGGHLLGYVVSEPHAGARDELLHATGHSYFPSAVAIGVTCLSIALAGAFARGIGGRYGAIHTPRMRTLAAIQTVLFLLLESIERLVSGVEPWSNPRPIVLGIALQILVAVGLAVLLRILERAGERIAGVLRRPRGIRLDVALPPVPVDEPLRIAFALRWSITRRGPPHLRAAG